MEPSGQAVLLRTHGNARAMAIFLGEGENPEAVSTRFNGMTPVSWAIARATADNIPYVIVERGDQLRIHASRKDAARRSSACRVESSTAYHQRRRLPQAALLRREFEGRRESSSAFLESPTTSPWGWGTGFATGSTKKRCQPLLRPSSLGMPKQVGRLTKPSECPL